MATLQFANVFAFVANMVMNSIIYSFVPPLTDLETISDEVAIGLGPAGFTFSIWGIIYLLLLIFVVYQALPADCRESLKEVQPLKEAPGERPEQFPVFETWQQRRQRS